MQGKTGARSSIARKVLHFVASVAIALAIGKAIEIFDGGNIAQLMRWHEEARQSVEAFEPARLVNSYLCNFRTLALNEMECSPVPNAALSAAGLKPYAKPPEAPSPGMGLLAPLAALLGLFWQLIDQPATVGTLFALLQFGVGFIIMLWLNWRDNKGAGFWYFLLPLGTVCFAVATGYVMQGILAGGLALFGAFTKLAGICCGCGTAGALGYEFCLKAVEVKTHDVATDTMIGP